MSHIKSIIFCVTLIVACNFTTAIPTKCNINDNDCRERRMHPDLRDQLPMQRLNDAEYTNEYWINQGKQFVKDKLEAKINKKIAKNVILFLGDGMGLTTLASARNLLGGEEKYLSFEKFPYTGLSKTYSVDLIVSDSACTATAYLCGVKAQEGTIGVNGNVDRDDCKAMQDEKNHVHSIAKWAMDAGKSAGFVTTTRVTHASPSGVYAHIADRDWENDVEVKKFCGADTDVHDIAYQLIHGEVGKNLKVIMGGGKKHFIDSNLYNNGERSDGLNLIDVYKNENPNNVFVESRDELFKVDLNNAGRLMGIYQDSHMQYHLEAENLTSSQPTFEEMIRKTIEFLSKNDDGYVIFAEGGKIDIAHHDNLARTALDETLEFSKGIQAAREMTSEDDTLILVTADHSHSFSFAGYPNRGNDIFGQTTKDTHDKLPYMTLSYASGPSFDTFYDSKQNVRIDPTKLMTGAWKDTFPATFPMDSETHGGEDVPVFASGPWAHLFTGVYEQNAIPHMMSYAACIGDGLKACDSNTK